jgi:hypothetical protein
MLHPASQRGPLDGPSFQVSRKPISDATLNAVISDSTANLDRTMEDLWQRYRTTPFQQGLLKRPSSTIGEPVYVVARSGANVVFSDDAGKEFATGRWTVRATCVGKRSTESCAGRWRDWIRQTRLETPLGRQILDFTRPGSPVGDVQPCPLLTIETMDHQVVLPAAARESKPQKAESRKSSTATNYNGAGPTT